MTCELCLQVQNVVDGWAAAGERLQSAFNWSDQLASSVVLVVMLLLSVGLWVLGLRLLVTVGLLWVFRSVKGLIRHLVQQGLPGLECIVIICATNSVRSGG